MTANMSVALGLRKGELLARPPLGRRRPRTWRAPCPAKRAAAARDGPCRRSRPRRAPWLDCGYPYHRTGAHSLAPRSSGEQPRFMNTTGSLPAASPLRPHNTLEARDTSAIPGRVWPAGLLVGSLMVLAKWVAPLPGGPRRAASAAQPSHDEPPPLPQRRHLSGPRPALIARASRSAPSLTAEGGTIRRPCYLWFRTMVAVVLLSLLAAACSTSPEACAGTAARPKPDRAPRRSTPLPSTITSRD
jgi:hypothetical protein